ncbi:hypothetical protein Avbf_04828 [Armadillidium vulgare]|nr:hypothetical protein Avbf_04828 [Armadillidium vulgare]
MVGTSFYACLCALCQKFRYKSSNSTWVVVIKGAISPVTSFKGETVVKTEDEEIKEEVEMVEEEGRKDVEKEEVLWEVEDMGTVPSNSEISRTQIQMFHDYVLQRPPLIF